MGLLSRHLQLNLRDSRSRLQPLGAGSSAVEDGMASVQTEGVLQLFLSVRSVRVPRVGYPAVCMHQGRRTQIDILVPPVTGACGGAASAENALVHPVQLLSVLLRLEVFSLLGRVVILEVWLYRLVLLEE